MRTLLTLAVVLLTASSARANAGPSGPGWQYVQAVHRVECAESFPEYAFVLVRRYILLEPGDEVGSEFVELSPDRPLEYTSRSRGWAELLIVPRSVASGYPTAAELVEAVKSGHVPAVRHMLLTREITPSWRSGAVRVSHRVQRTKPGDGLEVVRTSWNPMWQWYAVGVLFFAAILFGGLWLARRIVRRVRAIPAR